jgi:hypothetical protein
LPVVQAENVPALPEQRSLLDYFRGTSSLALRSRLLALVDCAAGKSHERATCVQVSVGEQEYTTNPVYDDADPVWNENCTFTFQNPDELLIIRVLDRSMPVFFFLLFSLQLCHTLFLSLSVSLSLSFSLF